MSNWYIYFHGSISMTLLNKRGLEKDLQQDLQVETATHIFLSAQKFRILPSHLSLHRRTQKIKSIHFFLYYSIPIRWSSITQNRMSRSSPSDFLRVNFSLLSLECISV